MMLRYLTGNAATMNDEIRRAAKRTTPPAPAPAPAPAAAGVPPGDAGTRLEGEPGGLDNAAMNAAIRGARDRIWQPIG